MLSLVPVALAAFQMERGAHVSEGNPFNVSSFYVNPSYQEELQSSIDTATGTVKSTLESMLEVPSAYWIDVKSKVTGSDTSSVEGILTDAASQSDPPLVTLIVYDLPNRDCHAKASNGEICCTYNDDGTCDYDASGDCEDGIEEYKTDYIDPFAAVLAKFNGTVPIVLIIEPDSLPNLATNLDDSHCGNTATEASYTTGIPYAVTTLKDSCPECSLYVDAAHGGWLGWEDNLASFAELFADMGIEDDIRGFSLNVANYQPIGVQNDADTDCIQGDSSPESCDDPCDLLSQWNRGNNEMNYAAMLYDAMSEAIEGFEPKMVIDSGRNGVDDMRSDCANWCNIRGAGVGQVPTMVTGNTSLVDAYYWLKTPGESDGCTETLPSDDDWTVANGTCARYDSMCGSSDSLGSESGEGYAPEAGSWFDYQIKQLAENANLDGKAKPKVVVS